jgi:hypothetical protein
MTFSKNEPKSVPKIFKMCIWGIVLDVQAAPGRLGSTLSTKRHPRCSQNAAKFVPDELMLANVTPKMTNLGAFAGASWLTWALPGVKKWSFSYEGCSFSDIGHYKQDRAQDKQNNFENHPEEHQESTTLAPRRPKRVNLGPKSANLSSK